MYAQLGVIDQSQVTYSRAMYNTRMLPGWQYVELWSVTCQVVTAFSSFCI